MMQNSNLKQYWNNFVNNYSKIQGNQISFGVTLLNMLEVENAQSIFEAGCGPGVLIPYIILTKQSQCQYVSTDISEEMIEQCVKTVESKLKKDDQAINWTAKVADVEDLSVFTDNSFDIYYAGFVFHLINNPEKAFQEAFRILKPEGRIGFSVWGRKEFSDNYTILKETAVEVGYELPQSHNAFQLGSDQNKLRQTLSKIGFKNILMWNQNTAANRFTAEQVLEGQNPSMITFLKSDGEKFKKLVQILDEKITNKLNAGLPLMQDCLLVVCWK